MRKIFDIEKIKRIPWTVVAIFIVSVAIAAVGAWQGGVLSVLSLLLIVIVSISIIRRETKKSVRAVLDAKLVEAEKQAMEMKLQESQISIMLSQIQPHFLYNTLNSIYQLCETNPMRARSMVNSFAEYLRNNLSTLTSSPGPDSYSGIFKYFCIKEYQ